MYMYCRAGVRHRYLGPGTLFPPRKLESKVIIPLFKSWKEEREVEGIGKLTVERDMLNLSFFTPFQLMGGQAVGAVHGGGRGGGRAAHDDGVAPLQEELRRGGGHRRGEGMQDCNYMYVFTN